MMAAEEALEADREALDGLAPRLVPILSTEHAALRGDTADLIGRIGHPVATNALRTLLDDPNPDVAEIASEALEQVRHRSAT
jgi:HEAT repeat protein